VTSPTKPNLTAGIFAAVIGALLGAIAWATLTSVTNVKIGYAAIGVGALAGFFAGKAGGGASALPPIAAGIGLIGCVVGDILTDAHGLSKEIHDRGGDVSMFRVLKEMVKDPSGFGWELFKAGFDAIDVLFYVIAAVAAFRLAMQHGLIHQNNRQGSNEPWAPPATEPTPPSA
jgi:hypothetical protein